MTREKLNNLQIIEYLKRTKEDTTIEEHRMALDEAIHSFENRAHIKPQCCGDDMLISNGWYHCRNCDNRFVIVPHNKETIIIASMLVEYVNEYDPFWEELRDILHELWRQGHYEGYEPKVPDNWNTSISIEDTESPHTP